MTLQSLSLASLGDLPAEVGLPTYASSDIATGIVHFGPGAFHRAHQADYIDRLLARDPRWGIAAVSLRSTRTIEALARQDGLYSLSILDHVPRTRVIGAHRAWLGPGDGARLKLRLADPGTRIITMTVTEKGYCLDAKGALDFAHPDIVHDLARPDTPQSLVGWIVAGLAARRAAGTPPFTAISCDNVTRNGAKLRAATIALARARDPALADWIAGEGFFPDTMVDSITPASDPEFIAEASVRLGMVDDAAVQREHFKQWVIGEGAIAGAPDLESVGVIRTASVAGYERAKLRMLNAAHSTLAYLGLALGHACVADAMAEPALARFAERLLLTDIRPTLARVPGLDLEEYTADILARFRNPSIRHRLSQIAEDGSQKLAYRLLDTIAEARVKGQPIDRLAVPVAAWMAHVHRSAARGTPLLDPLAHILTAAGSEADGLADRLLALRRIFPPALAGDRMFRAAIDRALHPLIAGDFATVLAI